MFRDELRKLRIENKYTQEELARELDVSKSTISMYESGSRLPGLEMLEAIADFFNVDMNKLTSNGTLTMPFFANEKRPTPAMESGLAKEFMELYSQLTPDRQKFLVAQVKGLLLSQEQEPDSLE